MKLWNFLKEEMLKHPQQIICENAAELTYEEMVIYAEELSQQLNGLKCCAILCQSEMATATALLSCIAKGITALPLSYRYGEVHCKKILEAISPDGIILEGDGQFQILHIKDAQYAQPDEVPAVIMCTSGTTGNPKGAMLTEKNIITNVSDICLYFDLNASDTILIARPLYHSAVLTGEFLTALIKGTGIRFYSGTFNPGVMLEMINEYKITAFCGTPTLLSMMARFKRNDKQQLRCVCISGECMSSETAKQISNAFIGAKIYHVYGLTEASPRVSYLPCELFERYPDCVGVPLKSVELKILKDDGNVAKQGEEGILWVKGNNVMAGYYNDPDKTKATIKDGWLYTGDIACINETGLLKIKGRKDNLIIKAGMNIYPQEIESALKYDKRVYDVVVVGKRDELSTQIIMNIAGEFDNVEQVKDLCKQALPSYAIPSKINLLSQLKRNGSGKLVREVS